MLKLVRNDKINIGGKGYMAKTKKLNCSVDVVFVIDATGSMRQIMEKIKQTAIALPKALTEAVKLAGKSMRRIRFKVIDFADFKSEGKDTIHESEFYNANTQIVQIINEFDSIKMTKEDGEGRGGDEIPENALEAVWLAMNSDFIEQRPDEDARQIIMVFTDASPLRLQERAKYPGYSRYNFPKNIDEMRRLWGKYYGDELHLRTEESEEEEERNLNSKLNPACARMLLYAPLGMLAGHTWDYVAQWERVSTFPVVPYDGCLELVVDRILDDIIKVTNPNG